jgi:hypothetical protein
MNIFGYILQSLLLSFGQGRLTEMCQYMFQLIQHRIYFPFLNALKPEEHSEAGRPRSFEHQHQETLIAPREVIRSAAARFAWDDCCRHILQFWGLAEDF